MLRECGAYSITFDQWRIARQNSQPLKGHPVIITFDDGYENFMTNAWPVLQRHGFSATLFVVAGQVGGWNTWDARLGEPFIPLLGWDDLRRLRNDGVEFGSHSMTHRHLPDLSNEDVIREAVRSQMILEQELGCPIQTFAYPFGHYDGAVEHWIGACGYTYAVTCNPGLAVHRHSLLALPRIEVGSNDSIDAFARNVGLRVGN
jgi:peptidoglycan/xylan/chitin deacetylase (PgdA/CDA1 family)